jgi:hypothetical protein
MVGIFGDENLGHRCLGRQATFDQPRRSRSLHDNLLAGRRTWIDARRSRAFAPARCRALADISADAAPARCRHIPKCPRRYEIYRGWNGVIEPNSRTCPCSCCEMVRAAGGLTAKSPMRSPLSKLSHKPEINGVGRSRLVYDRLQRGGAGQTSAQDNRASGRLAESDYYLLTNKKSTT